MYKRQGLMSINDAVNTRGYLSVEGMERPKLELKDDPAMKGVYTMTFTVHNTGSDTLYYDVTPLVLTDTTEAYVNGSGQEFSTILSLIHISTARSGRTASLCRRPPIPSF